MADYPVAGDDDRQGIFIVRTTHRPTSPGISDFLGDISIADSLPIGYLA